MLIQEQSNDNYHVDLFLYSQQNLKDNFKHIRISSLINLINLFIFFGIQVNIVCHHIDAFVFIVLILSCIFHTLLVISLIFEGISQDYHRYMMTQKLLYIEALQDPIIMKRIIVIEATIVGISIYQISEGAIERDGSAVAWVQMITVVIFIGVSFYKFALVYQTQQGLENLKQTLLEASFASAISS